MASANDLFLEVGNPGSATTLGGAGYTIGDTTITVGTTTNWPTATGVVFGIDRIEEDENGNTVRIEGSYCIFQGVVTSATTIGSVSKLFGDDQNYSSGASTRVYITVSTEHNRRLIEGILESHNQDGTLKDDIVTTAKISTSAVTTAKIADNAVATAKIANSAVTSDKLSLTFHQASVGTAQTTSATSPVDLTTVGPTATVVVGASGRVLVTGKCTYSNSSGAGLGSLEVTYSGANTGSFNLAGDRNPTANQGIYVNGSFILDGLTPGSTSFKLQYSVTIGTGTFSARNIQVVAI